MYDDDFVDFMDDDEASEDEEVVVVRASIVYGDTPIETAFTKSYTSPFDRQLATPASSADRDSPVTPSSTERDNSEEELSESAQQLLASGLPMSFEIRPKSKPPRRNMKPAAERVLPFIPPGDYWNVHAKVLRSALDHLDAGENRVAQSMLTNQLLYSEGSNVPLLPVHSRSKMLKKYIQVASLEEMVLRDVNDSNDATCIRNMKNLRHLLTKNYFKTGLSDFTMNDDVMKVLKVKGGDRILRKRHYQFSEDGERSATDDDDQMLVVAPKEENLLDFDFSFDPERDAHLIATNATRVKGLAQAIKKYWYQRNALFFKLADGILMDEEGWFSVTPESIAKHIAERLVTNPNCIVMDAFTGVGGNAIQFALKGAYVYAIDLDPIKIRCAKQNAKVYGVEDRITFFCGNFFHVAKSMIGSRRRSSDDEAATTGRLGVDAIFLSPPWGGPKYAKRDTFELSHCTPNGKDIFETALEFTENIAYFLPRNTSTVELMQLSGKTSLRKVQLEQNIFGTKVKALTAYYGNLVRL